MIPVFEGAKTLHVLDRDATEIGRVSDVRNLIITYCLLKEANSGWFILFTTWISLI
jgi:hypothetical protein